MSKYENMSVDRKRVVVVGASGRLGSALVGLLQVEHEVTAIGRKQMDIGSARSIRDMLSPLDYDYLFLTGAMTGVDYCETHAQEAMAVNAEGPAIIAGISANKGAHVTFISTDMVFDGKKREPYVESDIPNPISVYGTSKLAGEQEVLAVSGGNLVLRLSWVFGPDRPAFPEWIIGKGCLESGLTLPGDKICCPTFTSDAIGWIKDLVLGRAAAPASGVFHLCNSEPCSWREWGQFCIDTARKSGLPMLANVIEGVPLGSVPAFVAKRPVNSAMSTEKFTQMSGIRPRHWKLAIDEFLKQSELFRKYQLFSDPK
ncbi:MAG: NAD(P)-dependent oxidoreductase [Luteolibacter sp.]